MAKKATQPARIHAGELVIITINEGFLVLHPRTNRPHASGDRVVFSNFYARRVKEGALTVARDAAPQSSRSSSAEEGGEK